MSFLEDWKTRAGTVATTATMATHTHGSKETQGFSGTGGGGDNWRQVATFQDQGRQNRNCRHVSPTCRQAIQGATSRNTELVANVANVARSGEQKKEVRQLPGEHRLDMWAGRLSFAPGLDPWTEPLIDAHREQIVDHPAWFWAEEVFLCLLPELPWWDAPRVEFCSPTDGRLQCLILKQQGNA